MALQYELAAAGTTKYSSAATENIALVVGHQAVLYGFDGRNTDASNAIYVMVFDSATTGAVTAGTIPLICIGVPPAGSGTTNDSGNFGWTAPCSWGEEMIKGIVIAASSTDAKTGYTAVATGNTFFHVQYASEDGLSSR
jgi:hypothetical protein